MEPTIRAEGHDRRVRDLRRTAHEALDAVIDSGKYHKGAQTARLERVMEESWGGHAVATSSGTLSLAVALRAAGVGPGDEVIAPVTTFVSTVFAAAQLGAVPVLVDVDRRTRTMDPAAVEAALTPRTRALLPVHMHGAPADMVALGAIAGRAGLAVVEDCAQGHGARIDGQHVGTFGDFGCFSFWVGKTVGSLGDAGAVLAKDPQAVPLLRGLVDLGRQPGDRYSHHLLGERGRIDELDAAVVAAELELLDGWRARRQAIADRYLTELADLPLDLPAVPVASEHGWYKFAVGGDDPRGLLDGLADAGIEGEQIYPVTLAHQPALAGFAHRLTDTPVADEIVPGLVCLPCYPELDDDEVGRVVAAVRASVLQPVAR